MVVRILICILFFIAVYDIVASSDIKSSLAFVIDNTASMTDDIEEVKIGANEIFKTVLNTNTSQIEDFVLVTFRDPDFRLNIITRDSGAFKKAFNADKLIGNKDCPEMSMSGIELALEKSREGSFLYVFTDASAKDYDKYDEVEALAQKKGSQVIFVLTGVCYNDRTRTDYLVYQKLAEATNGQVFHLKSKEIGKILKYVENTIQSRKNVFTSKTFPAGYGHSFDVDIDGDTKELVIAVSGEVPSVGVTDSTGTSRPTTDITRLHEVAIVKAGVKPGVYTVKVGSKSQTHVVVTGSTSVHFQHGFSIITPSAISDTVTRPVPGEKSHLSIKLTTEGGDVTLSSVQLLDMGDNVIIEKPLKLIDKMQELYFTDTIIPPDRMFKIAIKGYDASSKTHLTRISLTPVKPQDTIPGKLKSPVLSIEGSPNINAEYDKPLQLKCKVSGYPRPSVTWKSDDKSALLSEKMTTVELPYDYVSVLDIRSVSNNATYSCKAVNSAGNSETSIVVQTIRPRFFEVVELPKDTTIDYKKRGQIQCKVNAYPPATVSWYKGLHPLKTDGNLELSDDDSVLTIRSMEPYMDDEYICETRNSEGRKVVPFRLKISGVEAPQIRKDTYYINTTKGSSVDIQCQITKGKPRPVIHWLYKNVKSSEFISVVETTDTIHFDKVKVTDAGAYKCIVKNVIGEDYHETELIVGYKPVISRTFKPIVTKSEGEMVTLKCVADGIPNPEITWKHNGAVIRSSRHTFLRDGSLKFPTVLSDDGIYECEARNAHGIDSIDIELDITVPVEIESPKTSSIEKEVGSEVILSCQAHGIPEPKITWVFRKDPTTRPRVIMTREPTELWLPRIQPRHSGQYSCIATNSINSKQITYEVSVIEPPSIRYTEKQYHGVMGDMQLRIPCVATGNPKPDITWSNKYGNIASGTEWFNVAEDGSLVIKNVDTKSEGYYICTASNKLGEKKESFDVFVDEYPKATASPTSITLEEGTSSVTIPCSVPYQKTDRLLWFKDGRMVSSSELKLPIVRLVDSGTYTCRVSSVDSPAKSGSTNVEVGFKPRFSNDTMREIRFVEGENTVLDCTATGEPKPQLKWFHDGKEIDRPARYEFVMTNAKDRGRYICVVSNKFGSVQKEFNILSFDYCLLDINNDFNENEPLILTTEGDFANFETRHGYMRIPRRTVVKLVCPSRFNTIYSREINVLCEKEQIFKRLRSGIDVAYSDLKCRDKLRPSFIRTENPCKNATGELFTVGFKTDRRVREIYNICIDAANHPIYTTLKMQPSLANVVADTDIDWFHNGSPINLDSLYDCSYQNKEFSLILHKNFHRRCCFARRMLVNPKDIALGLPQAATYTHLNVVPHWSTCSSKNWEKVEQQIRDMVKSSNRSLQVWTGTAQGLQPPDDHSELKNLSLNSAGKELQIPKYLWKVIQDDKSRASLAIIQVNVPDLRSADALDYMLCNDICSYVSWLKGRWRSFKHGFIYCCGLADFEHAFGYSGVFLNYPKELLD